MFIKILAVPIFIIVSMTDASAFRIMVRSDKTEFNLRTVSDKPDKQIVLTAHQKNLSELRERLKADPENTDLLLEIANTLNKTGEIKRQTSPESTLPIYAESAAISTRLLEIAPHRREYWRVAGTSHDGLGTAYFATTNLLAAQWEYQLAVDIRRKLAKTSRKGTESHKEFLFSVIVLGNYFLVTGDTFQAGLTYKEGLEYSRKLAGTDKNTEWIKQQVHFLKRIKVLRKQLEDTEGVRAAEEELVAIQEKLSGH